MNRQTSQRPGTRSPSFLSFLLRATLCASALLLLGLVPGRASAQTEARTEQQGMSWWVLNSTIRFHDLVSVYLELQPRAADFIKSPLQVQARGALNLHLNKDIFFSLGYVFTETWPYGAFPAATPFPEHRLWEQAQMGHQVGRVRFQHRGRLEQRFIGHMTKGDDGEYFLENFDYSNRMRYLIRAIIPLNHANLDPNTFFLNIYDEIFINFASPLVKANIFDQNRASLSLGYQATTDFSVQVGYINQFIEKSDGLRFESNHGLLVTVTYNPDLRPLLKKKPPVP